MSVHSRRRASTSSPGAADLRIVLAGSAAAPGSGLRADLIGALRHAGHDVSERPWRELVGGTRPADDIDLLILLEGRTASVPGQLAAIHAVRLRAYPTTIVLLGADLAPAGHVDSSLRRRLFAAVDVVVAHSERERERARSHGARDATVVAPPSGPVAHEEALTADWVRYVATLETIAARSSTETAESTTAPRLRHRSIRERSVGVSDILRSGAHDLIDARRGGLRIGFRDLPEWVRPTDVLSAHSEAAEVMALARGLRLPFTTRKVAAWSALGAVSAVLRVRDGDRRSSVIVDPSGPTSVFSRWARSIGYAPVQLAADAPIDPGTLDVMVRLHPDGCTSHDIDSTLLGAAALLRRGGLLCVTLPVGGQETPGAVLPADLRGVIARADTMGLTLVGDLDRDLAPLLTSLHCRIDTDRPGARRARALVRLTFRRTQ